MSEKQKKQTDPNEQFLQDLYESVCMGTDSVTTVLGKTDDAALRMELTAQLDGYQNFANLTRNKLTELNKQAKEVNAFAKMPAELSIMMTTMVNSSPSKIAEMMINGSTMGVIDLTRRVNRAKGEGVGADLTKLANDMIAFEEGNIGKLKAFL